MIRDSDIIGDNPWWRDPNKINDDPEIKAWMQSKLQIIPRMIHKITWDFESDNTVVYTLRGTRQIGKTTLIKLQIRKSLKGGMSPWNIFYCSLDLYKTPRELVDVIETYNRLTHSMWNDERRYIFLDEVTTIPNWQKGIKWLVDIDKITNSTIVATGSDAIDLQRSIERLPGRRGHITDSYDKILLPLKFAEYASALDPEINKIINVDLGNFRDRYATFVKLTEGKVNHTVERIHMYQHTLDDLLYKYMYSGGIPLVVNLQVSAWPISEGVYTRYMDGILGEWSKFGKSNDLLKRISREIVKSHGSRASWNGISKNADIGTHKTAQDTIQMLADLFVVLMIYGYNADVRAPMFRRNKKIYFADPFFFHLFNGWTTSKNYFDAATKYLDSNTNRGTMVESIVASHLVRLGFNASPNKQNFDHHYKIFYHAEGNKEVDFVYDDGDKMIIPIEVKYRNTPDRSLGGMYRVLNKTGGKGLVITKDRLDIHSEYIMIPTSVFLLLI